MLNIVWNRRTEERILRLGVENHVHDMGRLHRLELLLITRNPVFSFPLGLVATSIFEIPGIDRGRNGGGVPADVSLLPVGEG